MSLPTQSIPYVLYYSLKRYRRWLAIQIVLILDDQERKIVLAVFLMVMTNPASGKLHQRPLKYRIVELASLILIGR